MICQKQSTLPRTRSEVDGWEIQVSESDELIQISLKAPNSSLEITLFIEARNLAVDVQQGLYLLMLDDDGLYDLLRKRSRQGFDDSGILDRLAAAAATLFRESEGY